MTDLEIKKELIQRIAQRMNPVPDGEINRLLQRSLPELEAMLDRYVTQQEQKNADDRVREAQEQRASDRAWGATLARVSLNGKYLTDSEANKNMLESLLQPHETPSEAIYKTLALQFASKFSWHIPQSKQTDADRLAEFQKICRDNLLSECLANQQLHRDGVALDAWAGASGLERAKFQEEAARARQHFLIHDASPTQLKQEAAWESQQNREQAQREEATRQHQYVLSQQQQGGQYLPLPMVNANNETVDAKYLRRLSTLDYPLFKALVRKHGVGNLNSRLRGEG